MLLESRKALYALNASCVPPTTVLFTLFEQLMQHLSGDQRHHLIQLAAYYDHEIRNGGKAVWHLEAFVANFLYMYVS